MSNERQFNDVPFHRRAAVSRQLGLRKFLQVILSDLLFELLDGRTPYNAQFGCKRHARMQVQERSQAWQKSKPSAGSAPEPIL